jgi:hypothetical protein
MLPLSEGEPTLRGLQKRCVVLLLGRSWAEARSSAHLQKDEAALARPANAADRPSGAVAAIEQPTAAVACGAALDPLAAAGRGDAARRAAFAGPADAADLGRSAGTAVDGGAAAVACQAALEALLHAG